jgi:hypothetical protein
MGIEVNPREHQDRGHGRECFHAIESQYRAINGWLGVDRRLRPFLHCHEKITFSAREAQNQARMITRPAPPSQAAPGAFRIPGIFAFDSHFHERFGPMKQI